MKRTTIAVAVAALTITGVVAINQAGLKSEVKSGVERVVRQLNDAQISGENLVASLDEHKGGLFSSSGVITLRSSSDYDLNEFEVTYRVDHGITTLLSGASFQADVINTVLFGRDDISLTSELLSNQAITINGSLGSDSVEGRLTVPPLALAGDGYIGLNARPITTDFYAGNFNQDGSPGDYKALVRVPFLKFRDRKETFELNEGVLEFSSDFDGNTGTAGIALNADKLAIINENGRANDTSLLLDTLAMSLKMELQDEFSSDFTLTFDEFSAAGDALSNTELSYRLDGIDGEFVSRFITLSQTAASQGWSQRRVEQESEKIIRERADKLLAYHPRVEINRIRAEMNGELLIDAEGVASLDASRLPQDFLKTSLERNRDPDPQQLMQAILVEFEARLGRQASEIAEQIDPMMAAVLANSGDRFTFTMKDGESMMNGERI